MNRGVKEQSKWLRRAKTGPTPTIIKGDKMGRTRGQAADLMKEHWREVAEEAEKRQTREGRDKRKTLEEKVESLVREYRERKGREAGQKEARKEGRKEASKEGSKAARKQ